MESSRSQQYQSKDEVLLQIPVYLVNESGPLELISSDSREFQEDFLGENSSSTPCKSNNEIDWKEFSPNTEEYKSVLAKAIAGGTGHIIKGIFTCSNSYSKKVLKGGSEIMMDKEANEKNDDTSSEINGGDNIGTMKNNKSNTNLQRVEKLCKASEAIGNTVLEGEEIATGLMVAPLVKSKLVKALLSTAPGEVILASLDSFNSILGAAEAAETQTHSSNTMAATKLVSKSFGETAGKTTGTMLETAGSLSRTAWNIQKTLDPSVSIAREIVKSASRE